MNREKYLARQRRYNHSEKGRKRGREYARRRYYDRQDAGLCTACGKEPRLSDARCWDCLNKQEEWSMFRM
jgi:hypothetical protein